MTVENRIFIRRGQTELVTIVLEGSFLFFYTSHISLMPKATRALLEAQRHFSHYKGSGECGGGGDRGDRPNLKCSGRV